MSKQWYVCRNGIIPPVATFDSLDKAISYVCERTNAQRQDVMDNVKKGGRPAKQERQQ